MILVTGSTGLTGSAVVREFARQSRAVRAMVRNPIASDAWHATPGVQTVLADLLVPSSLRAALAGIDVVVLISSADEQMAQAQGNLIDAAVAAGVTRIVKVSGMGADVASPFRFARAHAQIEQRLGSAAVDWTLLRPSQFMQVYYREVPTMSASGTIAQPLGSARLAPIDVEDIAKIAYLTATGEGHGSKVYEMTGPQALTMTEVCEILTSVVGKPIRYVDITPAEKRQRLIDSGLPPRFADDLDTLFRLRREGGPESRVDVAVFDAFGIRPTSFADFARRSAPIFRGGATPERLWASGWQAAENTV